MKALYRATDCPEIQGLEANLLQHSLKSMKEV